MRFHLHIKRPRGRIALMLATAVVLSLTVPRPAAAGFFDFLFGTQEEPRPARPPAAEPDRGGAPAPQANGGGYARSTAHCVRMCDGRHFAVFGRNDMSPTAVCQAFCPATATKVFFGSQIERAISMDGERYADIDNAFAYRKTIASDCSCNGRDPVGLAPVDISLDTTLKPGDVVATSTGLVAYNGARADGQGEFTPVESYPGLSAATRARLGEMKIAPIPADKADDHTGSIDAPQTTGQAPPPRPSRQ
ncbi:DUF2865 domain-containing protein [Afipia sp. P52-10]|uniref:DUF2865 domain-containing protein n=1 Tax=Afipia sp. P52-10 TaxID=1429916 RepID=UPI0004B015C0|nr:DUF2865 domain-containing protein [Afipia sp. P52-10]